MNFWINRKLRNLFSTVITVAAVSSFAPQQKAIAADIELNQVAPDFELANQDGKTFKLSDRKGKWTVVYFYPKAGSPGCTEQACAFRDSIKKIEARGAILIGISADSQKTQKDFHAEHRLNFDLLADPDSKVISLYGIKVPLFGIARRTTFIVDPELKIRSISRDVDPAFDGEWSAETLDELQDDARGTVSPGTKSEKAVVPAPNAEAVKEAVPAVAAPDATAPAAAEPAKDATPVGPKGKKAKASKKKQ